MSLTGQGQQNTPHRPHRSQESPGDALETVVSVAAAPPKGASEIATDCPGLLLRQAEFNDQYEISLGGALPRRRGLREGDVSRAGTEASRGYSAEWVC